MTDSNPSTWQIGLFVANWMTRNNGENLEGEAEACTMRLREALKAAFPDASKADVNAAFQAIKAMLEPGSRH